MRPSLWATPRHDATHDHRSSFDDHYRRGSPNAGPLDVLLVDAALGPVRRFVPDLSTAKWAVSLARKPGTTARRLGGLGAEAGRILIGTSTVAPQRRDRRFTDIAWTENPLLKRLVQLYLAAGQTVEQLVIDADIEPRDRERVRFLLENLIEATAPSNVPLVNPASAKAVIDTAGLSLVRGGKQLAATWPRHRASLRWSTAAGSSSATTSPRRQAGSCSAPRCSS